MTFPVGEFLSGIYNSAIVSSLINVVFVVFATYVFIVLISKILQKNVNIHMKNPVWFIGLLSGALFMLLLSEIYSFIILLILFMALFAWYAYHNN